MFQHGTNITQNYSFHHQSINRLALGPNPVSYSIGTQVSIPGDRVARHDGHVKNEGWYTSTPR